MMLQGMAQHSGKHTGTTAAPDLEVVLDLLSASYMYFPLALAYSPWARHAAASLSFLANISCPGG